MKTSFAYVVDKQHGYYLLNPLTDFVLGMLCALDDNCVVTCIFHVTPKKQK